MQKRQVKQQKNKGWLILLAALVLTCAVAGVIYMDTFHGSGKLKGYVTQIFQKEESPDIPAQEQLSGKSMAMDDSTRATIVSFGKKFVLCTKDGVKYFNDMGDQKWNDTFNMTTPQMTREGGYVAVGDMSGKTVRVYDENGLIYSVQTEGTLTQFALNENGYLSVITKEGEAYHIQVYNAKGVLLKGRIEETTGIYPLSSDVSDDNKAFAVSYMDTTDIAPIGKVLFFYINPEDSEELTDSMFAGVEKEDEVIPTIAYMQGGVLAALSDKGVYGINGSGQETWSYELENLVAHISFASKNNIVLALGDSAVNKDGRKAGTICWVDTSGRESASYESGEHVTYLHTSDQGVIIGNGRDYTGLKNNGRAAWGYRSATDIRDMIPMESFSSIMVVAKESAVITQMRGQIKRTPEDAVQGDGQEESMGNTEGETNESVEENTKGTEGNETNGVQGEAGEE